jgi:hypothetical protein
VHALPVWERAAKAKIKGDISDFVQISVQCLNLADSKDFAAKAKADFPKTATLAIGAANLQRDTVPFWTRPIEVQMEKDGFAKEENLNVQMDSPRLPSAKLRRC